MAETNWDVVLTKILGATNIDRNKVTEKSWLTHGGVQYEDGNPAARPDDPNVARFWRYRTAVGSKGGPVITSYRVTRGVANYFFNGAGEDHKTYWTSSWNAIYAWPIVQLDKLTFDAAHGAFLRAEEYLTNTSRLVQELIGEIDTETSGFKGSAAEAFTVVLRNIRVSMDSLAADMKQRGGKTWSALLADNSAAIVQFTEDLRNAAKSYESGRAMPYERPDQIIQAILNDVKAKAAVDADSTAPLTAEWNITVTIEGQPPKTVDINSPAGWATLDTLAKDVWRASLQHHLDSKMPGATTALDTSFNTSTIELTGGLTTLHLDSMDPPETGSGGENGGAGGSGGGGGELDLGGAGGGGGAGAGGLDLGGAGGGGGAGAGGLDLGGPGGSGIGGVGGSGLPDFGSGSGLPDFGDGEGVSPLFPPLGSIPVSPIPGRSGGALLTGGGSGAGYAGSDDDSALLSSLTPTAIDGQDVGMLGGAPAPGSGSGGSIGQLIEMPSAGGVAGSGNGMGGMPFIPPMGGMGGMGQGGQSKERERTTWLAEDEEVWGTDPDCMPAVVGRDDTDTGTVAPRVPTAPYGPTTSRPGTTRTTRRGGG
ncbi:hypothetical protein AB0H83_41930 [Dactylosporangium sp. NPDC050688]|uniref:hypothetical protein n=1 Tax=Dactylosporangium sp. NPDC050688 TaxID=3157217 RepID=UPI0033EB067D